MVDTITHSITQAGQSDRTDTVDVALMFGTQTQKAPRWALCMSLILFVEFGCGGAQPS